MLATTRFHVLKCEMLHDALISYLIIFLLILFESNQAAVDDAAGLLCAALRIIICAQQHGEFVCVHQMTCKAMGEIEAREGRTQQTERDETRWSEMECDGARWNAIEWNGSEF